MANPIRALETLNKRIASTANYVIDGIDMRPLDLAQKTPTLFGDTLVIPNVEVALGVEIQSLARASTLERYAQLGRNVARFLSTNWTNTPSYETLARIQQNGTVIHAGIAATANLEEQGAVESFGLGDVSFDDEEGKTQVDQTLRDLTSGGLTAVVERVIEKDGHLQTQVIGTLFKGKSKDGSQSYLISVEEVYDPGMMDRAQQSSSRFLAEGVMVLPEAKNLEQKPENPELKEVKPEKWFSYDETFAPILREVSPAGVKKIVHIIKYDDPKLLNVAPTTTQPASQTQGQLNAAPSTSSVFQTTDNRNEQTLSTPLSTATGVPFTADQPSPVELPKTNDNTASLQQWILGAPQGQIPVEQVPNPAPVVNIADYRKTDDKQAA